MNVTFVIPAKAVTGGTRVVFEYADRLETRGHEVSVVYPVIPPHPMLLVAEQGIVSAVQKLFNDSSISFETSATIQSVPWLSQGSLDKVIASSGPVVATSWRTASAVSELPVSSDRLFQLIQHYEAWPTWNSHECWQRASEIATDGKSAADVMPEVSPNGRAASYNKRLVDKSLRLPLHKVAVSNWLVEILSSSFSQSVSDVILNGVNTSIFYPDSPLKTKEDRVHVLAPYRDAPWKGSKEVLEAFRVIHQRRNDVRFSVFGPIRGEVPDWVDFHAGLDDAALRRLYSSADIFVFPSWVEGFGLPPMEAMACETATVSTDVGAVRDVSIPGETIELVEPRSVEALTTGILKLINDPERRGRFARRGREHIQSFTWETAVDKLLKVLRRTQ